VVTAVFAIAWPVAVYLGVLTDIERRGLHDKAAHTVVVNTR
jgi:hypothetical protein